jgi:hypothetical protein
MKCYTHHTVDAVATCRACNRALCPDCVTEVGGACSCKNRCEERVAKFNAMLLGAPPAQMRPRFFSPLHGILGLVFLFWGIWIRSNPVYPFLVTVGAVLLVWSLIGLALHMRRN